MLEPHSGVHSVVYFKPISSFFLKVGNVPFKPTTCFIISKLVFDSRKKYMFIKNYAIYIQ